MSSSEDRRGGPRVVIRVPVELAYLRDAPSPADERLICESIDLSMGGARLVAPRLLDAGTPVLAVIFGGGPLIAAMGRLVASATDSCSGRAVLHVRFEPLREPRRADLSRLLSLN